jgi:hypothetical protein
MTACSYSRQLRVAALDALRGLGEPQPQIPLLAGIHAGADNLSVVEEHEAELLDDLLAPIPRKAQGEGRAYAPRNLKKRQRGQREPVCLAATDVQR